MVAHRLVLFAKGPATVSDQFARRIRRRRRRRGPVLSDLLLLLLLLFASPLAHRPIRRRSSSRRGVGSRGHGGGGEGRKREGLAGSLLALLARGPAGRENLDLRRRLCRRHRRHRRRGPGAGRAVRSGGVFDARGDVGRGVGVLILFSRSEERETRERQKLEKNKIKRTVFFQLLLLLLLLPITTKPRKAPFEAPVSPCPSSLSLSPCIPTNK